MRNVRAIGSAACLILLVGTVLPGCGPATLVVGIAPGGQQITATAVQRDGRLGSRRVAVIDVSGLIVNADQPGLLSTGVNPVSTLAESLDWAAADPRTAAVVLRINSPGGTVTASDLMYREVMEFRGRTGKPVVAAMMDVAASGGYYLACAADHVIAQPTTVTGSVGVVLQTVSVKPALERIGVRAEALVSGPNKAAGSPLETLDDGQRAVLQGLVDGFYRDFVAVVRERRTAVAAESWPIVADGRVFTGRRAYELGLVDAVGDLDDAFAEAKRRAGIDHADLFVLHRPLDYVGSVYARAPAPASGAATQLNLVQINLERGLLTGDAGFYYLWRPSLD
ncbi:MAG: signal peptide peptidase SppA [Planctomycetota bacterium]